MHDARRRGRAPELHLAPTDGYRGLELTEDMLALTDDILSRLESLLEATSPRRPEPPRLRLVPPGT